MGRVAPFFRKDGEQMQNKIAIVIEHGLVSQILATDPNVSFEILDLDACTGDDTVYQAMQARIQTIRDYTHDVTDQCLVAHEDPESLEEPADEETPAEAPAKAAPKDVVHKLIRNKDEHLIKTPDGLLHLTLEPTGWHYETFQAGKRFLDQTIESGSVEDADVTKALPKICEILGLDTNSLSLPTKQESKDFYSV